MVKQPRPGRVKTRLARDIGTVEAARWYRAQTAALLRRLDDPRWRLVLAVTPDAEVAVSRVWPAHLPRLAQGRGDLGARMRRCLWAVPGPALLIGSDIPGLSARHVAQGFAALRRADWAMGPAIDGGFWGIGRAARCHPPPGLFAGVRWSSSHAAADTRVTLGSDRVAVLATLADVDAACDLPPPWKGQRNAA